MAHSRHSAKGSDVTNTDMYHPHLTIMLPALNGKIQAPGHFCLRCFHNEYCSIQSEVILYIRSVLMSIFITGCCRIQTLHIWLGFLWFRSFLLRMLLVKDCFPISVINITNRCHTSEFIYKQNYKFKDEVSKQPQNEIGIWITT